MSTQTRVLIIKLAALGDMIQALGPMAAIRKHHSDAHITIMTTQPFADLLKATGYCDAIWIDTKPKWYRISPWLKLRRRLREAKFSWVYDLQTSDRSSSYFHLFYPDKPPNWSGIAFGCSNLHANKKRDLMHTIDRQAEQLKICGIDEVPGLQAADMIWADSDTSRFPLSEPFVLMVPGGAPHRPAKRWPVRHYTALAKILVKGGITPVLLGTHSEGMMLDEITVNCPGAINLCGLTSMLDLAALARRATAAIGNDTGPMHMIAITQCPALVLFSKDSDPALCAPRGEHVEIIRRDRLEDLSVDQVMNTLIDLAPGLETGLELY